MASSHPLHSPGKTPAFLLLCLLAGLARGGEAELTFAKLFCDHLVLQRDLPVRVWGQARPGATVHVAYGNPTGLHREAVAAIDGSGRWSATLDPLPACAEPGTLQASDGERTLLLQDVLVGEVWIASGQSNMQHPFKDAGLSEVAEGIDTPLVRVFRVATNSAAEPQDDFSHQFVWSVCVGKHLLWTTVVGYYFAARVQHDLAVPVGIVQAAFAGTSIHTWMSAEALRQAEPDGPRLVASYTGKPGTPSAPSGAYNAMIHPIQGCTCRGVIWYQGENNVTDPAAYRVLFPALIRSWRREFGQADLPFLYVQLAGWNTGDPKADWPGLRAAQTEALAIPHTGMAVTIDIGNPGKIHPPDKDIVGDRLARLALHRVYGRAAVIDSGPELERADFPGDGTVVLHFTGCGSGLTCAKPVKAFRISASNGQLLPAEAVIGSDRSSVILRHPQIQDPTQVTYAWDNPAMGATLVGGDGLPVAPFRSAAR